MPDSYLIIIPAGKYFGAKRILARDYTRGKWFWTKTANCFHYFTNKKEADKLAKDLDETLPNGEVEVQTVN